eukprot:9503873-Pyramimonas_sp.AAC.3
MRRMRKKGEQNGQRPLGCLSDSLRRPLGGPGGLLERLGCLGKANADFKYTNGRLHGFANQSAVERTAMRLSSQAEDEPQVAGKTEWPSGSDPGSWDAEWRKPTASTSHGAFQWTSWPKEYADQADGSLAEAASPERGWCRAWRTNPWRSTAEGATPTSSWSSGTRPWNQAPSTPPAAASAVPLSQWNQRYHWESWPAESKDVEWSWKDWTAPEDRWTSKANVVPAEDGGNDGWLMASWSSRVGRDAPASPWSRGAPTSEQAPASPPPTTCAMPASPWTRCSEWGAWPAEARGVDVSWKEWTGPEIRSSSDATAMSAEGWTSWTPGWQWGDEASADRNALPAGSSQGADGGSPVPSDDGKTAAEGSAAHPSAGADSAESHDGAGDAGPSVLASDDVLEAEGSGLQPSAGADPAETAEGDVAALQGAAVAPAESGDAMQQDIPEDALDDITALPKRARVS